MSEQTTTNTNTSTTVVSNSAEVIEKTAGLYDTVQYSAREILGAISNEVNKRLEKTETLIKGVNDSIISAEVTIKLDKAVEERTQQLSERLAALRETALQTKAEKDFAEHELNLLQTFCENYEREIRDLTTALQTANKDLSENRVDKHKYLAKIDVLENLNLNLKQDNSNLLKMIEETRNNSKTSVDTLKKLYKDELAIMLDNAKAERESIKVQAIEEASSALLNSETRLKVATTELNAVKAELQLLKRYKDQHKGMSIFEKLIFVFK